MTGGSGEYAYLAESHSIYIQRCNSVLLYIRWRLASFLIYHCPDFFSELFLEFYLIKSYLARQPDGCCLQLRPHRLSAIVPSFKTHDLCSSPLFSCTCRLDLRSVDLRSVDSRSIDLRVTDLRSTDRRSIDLNSSDIESSQIRLKLSADCGFQGGQLGCIRVS